MIELLRRLAIAGEGLIRRRDAVDEGLGDRDLARAVRHRELVRVRRGFYVMSEMWTRLDQAGRHRLMARAVLASLDVPAVATDVTAAVLLGIDVWGVDLSIVHVARTDVHAPRLESGVHHHVGRVDESRIVKQHGIPVIGAAETVVGIAQRHGFEVGVVCADAAQRLGLTSEVELREVHESMRTHRGARAAGRVVAFADGRAESVGESRTRVLLHEGGLPAPVLQRRIYDEEGFVGRVDLLIEEAAQIVEFDGRVKYRRPRDLEDTTVADPGEIVWVEKIREDRLRAAGYGMTRLVWADLQQTSRSRTISRLHAALRRRGWGSRRA